MFQTLSLILHFVYTTKILQCFKACVCVSRFACIEQSLSIIFTIFCLCAPKELNPSLHCVVFWFFWLLNLHEMCCTSCFVLQGLLWGCALANRGLAFPTISFIIFYLFWSLCFLTTAKSPYKHHSETPVLPRFNISFTLCRELMSHLITGRKPTEKCCSIIRVSIRESKWQPINPLFFTHPSVFFLFPAIHSCISQSIY